MYQSALSLRQLIEIAGDIQVLKPRFTMRSGVVNHDIVYESMDGTPSTHESLIKNDFVGELVNYVILYDVAENITTGAPAHFDLQGNVKGNGVFWAKPSDAIANNLYKNNREKKMAMPSMLAGVGQNLLVRPKRVNSLWEGVKHLATKGYEAAGGWRGIAHAASALLLEPPQPTE